MDKLDYNIMRYSIRRHGDNVEIQKFNIYDSAHKLVLSMKPVIVHLTLGMYTDDYSKLWDENRSMLHSLYFYELYTRIDGVDIIIMSYVINSEMLFANKKMYKIKLEDFRSFFDELSPIVT